VCDRAVPCVMLKKWSSSYFIHHTHTHTLRLHPLSHRAHETLSVFGSRFSSAGLKHRSHTRAQRLVTADVQRWTTVCVCVCEAKRLCRKGFCNTHSWKISFRTFLAQSRGYGSVCKHSLSSHPQSKEVIGSDESVPDELHHQQMHAGISTCSCEHATQARFHRQGLYQTRIRILSSIRTFQ